jgi:phospholipase C
MTTQRPPIDHVVILVKENHTFDNYFGRYPGADGVALPDRAADRPHLPPFYPLHYNQVWRDRASKAPRQQYGAEDIPLYWEYAKRYTLCDRYFSDVAGPSDPNHLMMIAADAGGLINNPHGRFWRGVFRDQPTVPPFDIPSLPDLLDRAGLQWRNYGGGNFNHIKNLAGRNNPGNEQFARDARAGKLPAVSWVYAPQDLQEESPAFSVLQGMAWTGAQVDAVVEGGLWERTAIFIVFDDWGGWYDHVEPPRVENWDAGDGSHYRYGSRVPCMVLSPYARPGHVSHQLNSHVSLVRFAEDVFGLPHLNHRDRGSNGLSDAFDFKQVPLPPPPPSTRFVAPPPSGPDPALFRIGEIAITRRLLSNLWLWAKGCAGAIARAVLVRTGIREAVDPWAPRPSPPSGHPADPQSPDPPEPDHPAAPAVELPARRHLPQRGTPSSAPRLRERGGPGGLAL